MTSDNVANIKETKVKVEYLKELLMDRTVLSNYPNMFLHVSKILEKEILRTRSALLSIYGIYSIADSDLPEPSGPKVNLQCKVYMPTDANSSFNFVGRILGPDGSTAKCLQQCLGVKIMVRGRGSMRDRKKEEANIGRPNWEHLSDKLHVVLTVDDFESRAKARLAKASDYITLFLEESTKGSDREDKVKQMQLMELSFQRDLRSSWSLDCHNLMDLGRASSLYTGPASLLNFAYPAAYTPAPLFPAIHEASQQHHGSPPGFHGRHYYSPGATQQAGQQTQPTGQHHHQQHHHQQQQQHSQGHFIPIPSSHGGHLTNASGTAGALHSNQQMAAAAAMSVEGLAFPSSSLSTNLGNAALLLGPASAQSHHHHHHTGAYSPPIGTGGQLNGNSASTLPPGTVAVAPMSYWQAGPSTGPHPLSQMTAAALDYRHLQHHQQHQQQHHQQQQHHPHHLHQTGQEHLQQAVGYPLPGAAYATATHLAHSLGFSGELIQPALAQYYPLCSRDVQSIESGSSSSTVVADAATAVTSAASSGGDARVSEASLLMVHPVENSRGTKAFEGTGGSDASATNSNATTAEKPGKHAQANTVTPSLVSGKNSSVGGASQQQTPAKYNSGVTGTGTRKRYLQNHHGQSNSSSSNRNSQQQPQPSPLSIHAVHQQQSQKQQQQHQNQHGSRPGRSEIATVRVGSNSHVKPVHVPPGGETANKGGFVATAKQKSSPLGNNESVGVKPEPCSTGGPPAMAEKETRTGVAVSRPPATNPTATTTATAGKKSTLTPAVVSTNDTDWPKVGTDVKLNSAVQDSQICQGLLHLSIGNTSSKAI